MKLDNQINKIISTLIVTGLCLIPCGFFSKIAKANLFVSPIYLELQAEKTQTTGFLQISNQGEKALTIRLSTAFTYDELGVFQRIPSGGENDLTPYIRYAPKELTIPPQSERNIRIAAILPPSLPNGEYRVAIYVETLPENNNPNSQYKVNFVTSIGSAIYVRKGDVAPNLQVEKALFEADNKELRLGIFNQGKATGRAKITWKLLDKNEMIAEGTVGKSFLPQKRMNVLLNSSTLDIESGIYQLVGEIIWKDGTEKKQPFDVNVEIR
jgi:hypothetical protein